MPFSIVFSVCGDSCLLTFVPLASDCELLLSRSVMPNSLQPHGLYSIPGFPVFYYLLELAQTHVH